jgi:hypothetical protein
MSISLNPLVYFPIPRPLDTLEFISSFKKNWNELVRFFIEAVSKFTLKYLRNYDVKKCENYGRSLMKCTFSELIIILAFDSLKR